MQVQRVVLIIDFNQIYISCSFVRDIRPKCRMHNIAAIGPCYSFKASLTLRTQAAKRMAKKGNGVYLQAKEIIDKAGKSKPGLVVLDLDYTIWPFWCEMYSPRQTHIAQLFPESRDIIDACRDSHIPMAIASRSPTPNTARAFLKAVGLSENYFEPILIIPFVGKDQTHFPQIHSKLGTDYADMLFFDDEHGNIRQVSKLGVTSILVSTGDGLSLRAFQQGMRSFASKRENS